MDRPTPSAGEETLPGTGGVHSGQGFAPESRRAIGSVIAEDYVIEGHLGAGGMGVVYLARHTKLDRLVAIKELLAADPEGSERLLREAMAMARLDHPNVVRVFDARQFGDHVFIAMEYLPAGTLRTWGQHRRTFGEILEMYSKAAAGLMAAHSHGIVHRDFKPDNVLLTDRGEPKVGDFGVARAAPEAAETADAGPPSLGSGDMPIDLTRTGHVMGTPAYMAPEQFGRYADARSDQFAFCIALYEAFYGKRPFAGPTPAELWVQTAQGQISPPPMNTDVPERVHRVLRRGLDPNPAHRFPDMDRLVSALRRAAKPLTSLVIGALVGGLVVSVVVGLVAAAAMRKAKPTESLEVSMHFEAPKRTHVLFRVLPMRPPPKLDEVRRYDDPEPPAEGYNPEGYKTWVGTFVCDKKAQWFYYVQAHAEGVVVDARDGCDFRCIGCDLSGDVIVKAEGNASVDLNSCNLHATTTVVQAKDTSDVMLTAVGFDAKAGHPAVSVSDEAEFSLYRSELRAVRPIEAKGAAKLIFDEVTLIGSDGALWATPGVKIKEFSDVHYVGEKLTTWEPEPEPEPSEHEESF